MFLFPDVAIARVANRLVSMWVK